jgi:chemotaxis protein MotB
MNPKLGFFVSCFGLILLSACVAQKQYQEVEAELENSRVQMSQAEKNIKSMQAELDRLNEKLKKSENERQYFKNNINKCADDLAKLQVQNDYLNNMNVQFSENAENLTKELQNKQSVIQLQGKVISLLDDTKKTIETSLKDQIAARQVEVVELKDKLKVIFVDKILFDTGSAEIRQNGKDLLLLMADSLKAFANHTVVVEGHTDNVPLKSALKEKFPSNWELSTARAAVVAHFLQKHGGLDPARLSACGFSYFHPVGSNDTAEGRRLNRRIEIILGPAK